MRELLVDLDTLSADDLQHLACIWREKERRAADQAAAALAEVVWQPALGAYRGKRQARSVPDEAAPAPTRRQPWTAEELRLAAADLRDAGVSRETSEQVLAELAAGIDLSAAELADALGVLG